MNIVQTLAFNYCCFLPFLFVFYILFSNHVIKLTDFINLIQLND